MSTNTTVRDPIVSAERLALFPSWLIDLTDEQWVHAIAGFIADEVGQLDDDAREDLYAGLVALRMQVHQAARAVAA